MASSVNRLRCHDESVFMTNDRHALRDRESQLNERVASNVPTALSTSGDL
jgi:hypothetical protein